MAVLAAPDIDWGGLQPQSEGSVVSYSDIMVGGPPPIYSGGVLTAPSSNQLINDAATGTPM